MSVVELVGLAALAGLTLAGAILDIRTRVIPNALCALCLVAGLVFVFFAQGAAALPSAGLHVILALAVGMGLFALKFIGGGDAKFYAGLAGWFPLSQAADFLILTSLSGIVLVLVHWLLLRKRERPQDNPDFAKLPYAVAIALGAFVNLALHAAA